MYYGLQPEVKLSYLILLCNYIQYVWICAKCKHHFDSDSFDLPLCS